jgi:integrase
MIGLRQELWPTLSVARDAKDAKEDRRFQRIGPNLYRRDSHGTIYARTKLDDKRIWRSTGTDEAATARKVFKEWHSQQVLRNHGVEPPVAALERRRYTVNQAIDSYIAAGIPDRKMRRKKLSTIETETKSFQRLRPYFGHRAAVGLKPADCDAYRDWRMSGGYKWQRGQKNPKEVKSRAGNRLVDIELQSLGNVLELAKRQQKIRINPLRDRVRYHSEEDTRHCREVAPTPQQLEMIERAFRLKGKEVQADLTIFLAGTGLRINEARCLDWEAVDWKEGLIHVQREKRGINPWVPILEEMETHLRSMQAKATSHLLFPSSRDPSRAIAYSTFARSLTQICRDLGIKLVTPHGLRSYIVTQCRQAGLTDAEIAMLIGDKSGPAIISTTYGDVRPDHLLAQTKRVRLRARKDD